MALADLIDYLLQVVWSNAEGEMKLIWNFFLTIPKEFYDSVAEDCKSFVGYKHLASVVCKEKRLDFLSVSDILADLVGAAQPLAQNQKHILELSELSQRLPVDVEEPALRQALNNLIDSALLRTHVGGKVKTVSVEAPAGGALVVIDDDGPDINYMFKICLQKNDHVAAITQMKAMMGCTDFTTSFLSLAAHESVACHALPVAVSSAFELGLGMKASPFCKSLMT